MKRKTLFLGAVFCFFSLALQAQWATSYTNSSGTRNYCDAKFISNTVGYVLAQEGEVLKTTDGGVTWTTKTPLPGTVAAGIAAGSAKTMTSFDFISESTGFVVGQSGLIYKTTDGAQTWSSAIAIGIGSTTPSGTITRYLNNIRFYDSNTGYIMGNAGTVIKTTDGGTTWTRIINEATNGYNFASLIDANTLRIAPSFWAMYKLSSLTLSNATNITTNSSYYGSFFFDANNGYVVGYRGSSTYADILKTTDGGTTWTQTINTGANNTTTGTTLRSVTFTDTNNGIAVGLLGSVYETSNAGTSWTKNNNALFNVAFYNVTKLANGHKFIVGTNKILRYSIPVILDAATANAFTTTYGTASGSQTFSVSGLYLTANLVATVPGGFEVSSDGTTYGSTATFTPSSGSASGTLSIRLKADAAVSGTYNSQNIVLSSTGATSVNIVTAASGNSVSAKALTITANNQTVAYGTLVATVTGSGTYSPTGFVNGQDASVISGSATFSTNYTNSTAAGTSGITITPVVTGLTATNYSFTPAEGSITITPADVTVSNSNVSVSDLILSPVSNITVNTNGSLVIDQSKQIASVTVNAGAKLSVSDGQTLTLTNLTLKSDVNATSTYVPTGINKTGTITVTGTTAVEQYLATTRNWYVSSPVSNSVAPANYTYYSRYEPGGTATGWTPVSVGAGLVAGKGYIALPTTAGAPITFTTQSGGTLNNGTVTIPLTYSPTVNSGKGYNLIGNPYPSHLSWTFEFTQANSSKIESTIWYRTNSGGSNASGWSFITFNPVTAETVPSTVNGGIIPPMQAFWVLAKNVANNSIQFTNAMRSHQTGNLLKAPAAKNADRKKIRLQLSNGTTTDEALIVFDANASNDYDSYDSPKMMNNAPDIADIYTVSYTKRLVINGLNAVTNNMILPLGYNAGVEGNLTLKVNELSNFDGNTRVYLVDGSTETELAKGTEYTFNTAKITGNESRFSLLFRAPNASTGIENTEKGITQVFVNANNQITIIAPEKASYSVYNAVGQMIENGILNAKRETINAKLNAGVYVVNVNNQLTKVIIK